MTAMRSTSLLLVAALALAACSGADAAHETTTTAQATTTEASTTTTTVAETTTTELTTDGPASPINGLVVEDESLLDRRALVVKIDNHPNARPQTGLSEADAVIELMVEGITRLVAVFHTGDAETVGPIRSMRPTDGQTCDAVRRSAGRVRRSGLGGLEHSKHGNCDHRRGRPTPDVPLEFPVRPPQPVRQHDCAP